MNSATAADRAGVSYRQLDYWIRKRYIKSSLPGSGYERDIPGEEAAVLTIMAELVDGGLNPQAASRLAREHLAGRPMRLRHGSGRFVIIEEER